MNSSNKLIPTIMDKLVEENLLRLSENLLNLKIISQPRKTGSGLLITPELLPEKVDQRTKWTQRNSTNSPTNLLNTSDYAETLALTMKNHKKSSTKLTLTIMVKSAQRNSGLPSIISLRKKTTQSPQLTRSGLENTPWKMLPQTDIQTQWTKENSTYSSTNSLTITNYATNLTTELIHKVRNQ